MRNLCFTERSLQFSRFAPKSLGSPISLSSLSVLPLSMASLSFLLPTDGAYLWELPLPPSLWLQWRRPGALLPRACGGAQLRLGAAEAEQALGERALGGA
jgi:hypothetical protein